MAVSNRVLYLCDRRACKNKCSPECFHTTDIRHARNFVLTGSSMSDKSGDFIETGGAEMSQYTNKRNHRTCNYCGANLDYGESCDCQNQVAPGNSTPNLNSPMPTSKGSSSLLNPHGQYVMKFAEAHNLSITEAHNHPMVKAHLAAYNGLKDSGYIKGAM